MSYINVFKKTFISNLFYIKELFLNSFSLIIQSIFAIFIGIYLNNVNPVFSSINNLFIYYLIGNGIFKNFERGNVIRKIEHKVINGNINVHLIKPYDFVIYMLIKDFSKKVLKFFINFFFVFLIINLFYPISLTPLIILRTLIITPFVILFINLNVSIFAYLTLIFEKIRKLFTSYMMLGYFFTGGFISFKYFPNIVNYLPQFFFFGAPIEYIIYGKFPNLIFFIIYYIIFIFLTLLIRKIVYKRIELNG